MQYQQCVLSVMDNIADPGISFDEKGICNYYYEYKKAESELVFTGIEGKKRLDALFHKIKESGKGKQYDCVLGISGGVDSTYLAYLCKKEGIRALCVHFDNGWNSELAVMNIQNIIQKCGFDLFTEVINWEEFRDVQLSFLKAGVIDIEAITDVGYPGTLHNIAKKYNISYILDGNNVVTEYTLPKAWYFKDPENVKDIHKKFGTIPLKTLRFRPKRQTKSNQVQSVNPLNLVDYNKDQIKETIIREIEWRDYGGKHYESIWTKFYQGYILPTKFKVDKRKAHLSNLIFSGQMTREQAVEVLKTPAYDLSQLERDKEYVLKKLGLTSSEFDAIMNGPIRQHTDFYYTKPFFEEYPFLNFLEPFWKKIRRYIIAGA